MGRQKRRLKLHRAMGMTKWSAGAASPDGHDGFDGWSCVVLWLLLCDGTTKKEDDRSLAAQDGRDGREGSCCHAMAQRNMMKLLSRNKGRMSPNVLWSTT